MQRKQKRTMISILVIGIFVTCAIAQRQFYVYFNKEKSNLLDLLDRDRIGEPHSSNPEIIANFALPQLMKSHLRGMNTLEQSRIRQVVVDAKDLICQGLITKRLSQIHAFAELTAKRGGVFANSTVCNNADIVFVEAQLLELFTGGGLFKVLNAAEVGVMIQEETLDILMVADQRVEAKLRQCFPDCSVSVHMDEHGGCVKYDVAW